MATEAVREVRPIPEAAPLPSLLSADRLLDTEFPPVTFAVEPYLPRAEVTELVGAHGIFKSTAALGACLSVATGRAWGGARVTKGFAIFITMEDGERTIAHRTRAWLEGVTAGKDRAGAEVDVRENLFFLAREQARELALTASDRTGTYQRESVVQHLAGLLCGSTLVVLETASRLHDGPEMNEGLAVFAQAVERIAVASGAAVAIVRHVSKQAARDGTSDSYAGRGGGAFSDAARSVLVMAREKKTGEDDPADDAVSTVTLTHAKATLSAPGPRIVWRPVVTPHGVYLWALTQREEANAEERKVLAYVAAAGSEGVTAKALHVKPPTGITRGAARAALERLVASGLVISTVEDRPRNRGVTVYRARESDRA